MTVQNTEKPNTKKRSGLKVIGYGVVTFFFIFLVIAIFDENGSNNTHSIQNQNETFDDLGAYIQGQFYIKQVLKSPATAEFPPLDFLVHRLNNNRFEVISYVDSQNSFGALFRSSWNVLFQYQNEKTYLERITVNGKVIYPIQESDNYKSQQEVQKEIQKTQKMFDDIQREMKSYE